MCKAFPDVLQGVITSSVHVIYNAHILSLVIDISHMQFCIVDSLVSSMKKAFKHCPGHKLWYKESIANQSEESCATVVLPPELVLTR